MLDKLYSVGFDGKLIIYDCPFGGSPTVSKKLEHAHDAGITCLIAQKNPADNDEWLMTGSFDKTAKVWSLDGKLIFKFSDFTQPVTGLTYVQATKTVWIGKDENLPDYFDERCVFVCLAAGNSFALVYDPKNGENVSSFIGRVFSALFPSIGPDSLCSTFQIPFSTWKTPNFDTLIFSFSFATSPNRMCSLLRRISNIASNGDTTTSEETRAARISPSTLSLSLVRSSGCISCLKVKSPLESVCYTKKSPILVSDSREYWFYCVSPRYPDK